MLEYKWQALVAHLFHGGRSLSFFCSLGPLWPFLPPGISEANYHKHTGEKKFPEMLYPSRPQDSFRNCRSSLAIRRFVPHLDCTASRTCLWISFFCGLASHTLAINIGEQSKRLASFHRLQVMGSLSRRLRISSISD